MVVSPIGDGFSPSVTNSRGTSRIRLPSGPDRTTEGKQSSGNHLQPGNVYANDLALGAIKNGGTLFPAGSILVREKPGKAGANTPDLLAVMIKRERGFNPDGGDWQFLVVNGAMTKVKLRQKTGQCLECHQSQEKSDFVFPLK